MSLKKILFVNPGESKNKKLTTTGKMQLISTLDLMSQSIESDRVLLITSPSEVAFETASIIGNSFQISAKVVLELRQHSGTNYISKAKAILALLKNTSFECLILVAHEDDRYVVPKEVLGVIHEDHSIQIPHGYGVLSKQGEIVVYSLHGCNIIEPSLKKVTV